MRAALLITLIFASSDAVGASRRGAFWPVPSNGLPLSGGAITGDIALDGRLYDPNSALNVCSAATSTHSLGTNDMICGGSAEFDGASYFDSTLTVAGAMSCQAVTATTVAASGAIAANGGITFDNSTDTLGACTLAGTLDASTQIITNIGNAGTDFVASTGALNIAGAITQGAASPHVQTACTATIADNGAGSNATLTLTPVCSNYEITCSDTQGCDITMGETGMVDGFDLEIKNVSAVAINFANTSGVSELSYALKLIQWESVKMRYTVDRWVQVGLPSFSSVGALVGPSGTSGAPGIALAGDRQVGLYLNGAGVGGLTAGGFQVFQWLLGTFRSNNGNGPSLQNTTASNTVPTLIPRWANTTTGVGSQAAGNMSLIANATEIARVDSTTLTAMLGFAATTSNIAIANLDTTFAVTKSNHTITQTSGASTIATITGGVSGQLLDLYFTNSGVTFTDTAVAGATAGQLVLSAAFVPVAGTIITLVLLPVGAASALVWVEKSRSANG